MTTPKHTPPLTYEWLTIHRASDWPGRARTEVVLISWANDRQRKSEITTQMCKALGYGGIFEIDLGATTVGRTEITATRNGREIATGHITPASAPGLATPAPEQAPESAEEVA